MSRRIADVLARAERRLAAASSSPRLDAEILLAHVLNRSRAMVLICGRDELAEADGTRFELLMQRRERGEPVAYITGRREFWSLPLKVTPDVLIPRPETELLVEWAVALCVDSSFPRKPESRARIADLGTGSGAIALALAKELSKAEVTATDLSAAALKVAQANAEALCIKNVHFLEADFSSALDSGLRRNDDLLDLIVSNPPYIAEGDPHLQDLTHEPVLALTSGRDGLDSLRVITAKARACLNSGGWLLVEHGYQQGAAVRQLFSQAGFAQVETRRDLAGHERATGGMQP